MADFNPDQYLKEKAGATPAAASFDPDAYLKSKAPPSWLDAQLPLGTTPRGLIQGSLNALPAAGMVAGGIAGTPADIVTGPTGTVVGAGIGAAAGQTLKEAGERFILGKDKSNADVLKNTVRAVPEGMAGEMGGQILGKTISAAANTPIGKAVISKAGSAAAKVGELFTGVPKSEIETYAAHGSEVDQMSSAADHNAQDIADQVRAKINEVIDTHRKGLNDQISKALETASKDKTVDITPVVDALEKQKAKLDPKLHSEDIADINELVSRVKGKAPLENGPTGYQANTEKLVADAKGMTGVPADGQVLYGPKGTDGRPLPGESTPVINDAEDKIIELPVPGGRKFLTDAQGLHTIQKWLQDKASGAYGQTAVGFQVGDQAAKAAKGAAGAAREILGDVAPEISAANAKLAKLHQIEDVMNKGMLAEGKTASPLMAAGAGANPANAKILKQLGQETGTDILGEAQKLSAARTFGKPQLMPVDSTGKAVGRMGLASGLGFIAGGPTGAVLAAGATSPAALKLAINTGRAFGASGAAAGALSKAVIQKNLEGDDSSSSIGSPSVDTKLTNQAPLKGEKKWMNDGAQKLIEHADTPQDKAAIQKLKGAAIDDPKTKDLLIKASDLKPGSKAMDAVMAKLKAKIAEGD